jgi:hypothetical protein
MQISPYWSFVSAERDASHSVSVRHLMITGNFRYDALHYQVVSLVQSCSADMIDGLPLKVTIDDWFCMVGDIRESKKEYTKKTARF